MKDYEYAQFDMYSFATELRELVKYRDMYHALGRDYEELQNKYDELLNSSVTHNEAMMGNFLELALHGVGGKSKKNNL